MHAPRQARDACVPAAVTASSRAASGGAAPRAGVERLRRRLAIGVAAAPARRRQGERPEAVLVAHPVDGLAQRDLAPAVVDGELEGVAA